jgi:uncharacterized protein with HEPN domain
MQKKVRPYLHDIAVEIVRVEAALSGKTLDDYRADWMVRHAVERCIEIISEATRRIPAKLRKDHSDVEWQKIISIGNVLRHEYADVVDEVLFRAATTQLTGLKTAILAIEAGLDEPID